MPRIIIRERTDRSGDVPVTILTKKGEEKYRIKREEPIDVSDAALEVLLASHEANYINILSTKEHANGITT